MIDAKNVVRRFYTELDDKNFDVFGKLCTEDFRSHFPGNPIPLTRAQREATSRTFFEAFPDLNHTIADMISERDRVAARMVVRGTHEREFMGRAATGKQISFPAMRFYRLENGRLAEEWVNFDSAGLLEQLGDALTGD